MKVQEESEKAGLKLNIQKTKIMASGFLTSWRKEGENVETMADFIFLDSKITSDGDCRQEINRHSLLWRKAMANLGSILKSRDITLLTKVHLVKAVFSSSHVWMWKLDHKKSWAQNHWCFCCGVGEDSWESLGPQEDPTSPSWRKSVLNIHWKDDADAEALILGNYWLIEKDPDAGKYWRQEEKEMVGWHHWLNGHKSEQAPRVGDGPGRPGVLQSIGSQRLRHDWGTELTEQTWISQEAIQDCTEGSEAAWHITVNMQKCQLT